MIFEKNDFSDSYFYLHIASNCSPSLPKFYIFKVDREPTTLVSENFLEDYSQMFKNTIEEVR